VVDVFSDDTLLCIEGNTAGQMIRSTIRPLIDPNAKRRIVRAISGFLPVAEALEPLLEEDRMRLPRVSSPTGG
jgi:phage terminase large subunit-like protein